MASADAKPTGTPARTTGLRDAGRTSTPSSRGSGAPPRTSSGWTGLRSSPPALPSERTSISSLPPSSTRTKTSTTLRSTCVSTWSRPLKTSSARSLTFASTTSDLLRLEGDPDGCAEEEVPSHLGHHHLRRDLRRGEIRERGEEDRSRSQRPVAL